MGKETTCIFSDRCASHVLSPLTRLRRVTKIGTISYQHVKGEAAIKTSHDGMEIEEKVRKLRLKSELNDPCRSWSNYWATR